VQDHTQQMLARFMPDFKKTLTEHIKTEEQLFFPYINTLREAAYTKKLKLSLEKKLQVIQFVLQHDDAPERSLSLLVKSLEEQFRDQEQGLSLRMLLKRLSFFERDLCIHAKIEDEVLIPMAFQLEKEVLGLPDLQIEN